MTRSQWKPGAGQIVEEFENKAICFFFCSESVSESKQISLGENIIVYSLGTWFSKCFEFKGFKCSEYAYCS